MALDTGQTRVAGTGTIYIGAYGVALPSSYNSALPSANYTDLGYTSEDGITFTDEPTIDKKMAWQSYYAIRIIETSRMAKIAFDLAQWNTATLKLAAGGGTVAAAGGGSKFSPHAAGTIAEWTAVCDITDGSVTDRYVFPRCMVVSNLETNLNRADLALLPVELEVIGEDGVLPWIMYSSDTSAFV